MNTHFIQQTHAPESDEIDLLDLIHQLLDHKLMIILVTSIVLMLGVVYSLRQLPEYLSETLIQIDLKQQGLGQASGMAQLLGAGTGSAASTQRALIESRFILDPVIQSLGLDISVTPKRSFFSRLFSSYDKNALQVKSFDVLHSENGLPFELVFDTKTHIVLYDATGKIVLQGATGSSLTNTQKTIHLQVAKIELPIGTRFGLKKIPHSTVIKELLNRLRIEESGGQQKESTGILEISLTGTDPIKIVQTLNAIATTAQATDAEKKSQEASQTLDFLYRQLPVTKGLLEKAEGLLNRYRAQSGKIDIKLQAKFLLDQLADLAKQSTSLRISKIDNLQKYTLEHPIFLAQNTQLAALETERKQLKKLLKKLPASDQIAVNLLRDVSVKKNLYLLLLNKIQELQVIKAGSVSNVHILSKATLPDGPLPTKRIMIYLGSIFLGLLASILVIFIRKLMNPSVADPHWSERHLKLANLAIIPYCQKQAEYTEAIKNKTLRGLPLLAYSEPRNLSIESLRSLRTSLQVTLASAKNNVVSILGVTPAVGKSFVSVNLAYLLASAGKRVVLVDGDLRRGTVHKYFNSQPTPGVVEVVTKKATLDESLVTSIIDNFSFLPRGTCPRDPSELIMSESFASLINTLSQQFDIVIIDTPPVLLVTDAVLIAAFSATNYLVLGACAHQPTDIAMVLNRLSAADVHLNGTVFNFYRAKTIRHSYGQYGKYATNGKYGKYNTYYYDESMKT